MPDDEKANLKGEDASPSAVPGSIAPTVMCKIFGHKWMFKSNVQERRDGELWNIKRLVQHKACIRCGQPNPNHEEQ